MCPSKPTTKRSGGPYNPNNTEVLRETKQCNESQIKGKNYTGFSRQVIECLREGWKVHSVCGLEVHSSRAVQHPAPGRRPNWNTEHRARCRRCGRYDETATRHQPPHETRKLHAEETQRQRPSPENKRQLPQLAGDRRESSCVSNQ